LELGTQATALHNSHILVIIGTLRGLSLLAALFMIHYINDIESAVALSLKGQGRA